NLDGADIVLTLKNYYRRRPDSLRQAEAAGVPIHILKSNTVTQVKEALARIHETDHPPGREEPAAGALAEAGEAIRAVKMTLRPLELTPQNAYVRRLQHQLVGDDPDVGARSTGKEPRRRLRIYPASLEG
ncbi:MAG: R3H domain-containing nucleic acid-binding protein, partial [Candidatus Dormibacteraceae bacterium]